MKKVKFVALLVVVILALLFWGYQKVERFADTPLAIQQEAIFKLPAGTGRVALEGLLVRDKLIRNGKWFPWLLKIEPKLAAFKAGTYRFTPA
ncbi:putative aminodeoxychorismate lyase [Serratia rubidaea]|uniref:Putative aminodeoxychorismate lyase n=1 Tax=Serratia rubidaea TaxID=61652 RepID=A0A3S4JY60_SERRU|nr:putative aminodeoxychorismate lyase [Serratia rubidaea]